LPLLSFQADRQTFTDRQMGYGDKRVGLPRALRSTVGLGYWYSERRADRPNEVSDVQL